MTRPWSFFVIAAISCLLLLNIAQYAVNSELIWQVGQLRKALSVFIQSNSDSLEQHALQLEIARYAEL